MDAHVFAIKAAMLGMWYDAYTHTFREVYPIDGCWRYLYARTLCADTAERMPAGATRGREQEAGRNNIVTAERVGGAEWMPR